MSAGTVSGGCPLLPGSLSHVPPQFGGFGFVQLTKPLKLSCTSESRPHESRQLTQSPGSRHHAVPHRGQASGSVCRRIEIGLPFIRTLRVTRAAVFSCFERTHHSLNRPRTVFGRALSHWLRTQSRLNKRQCLVVGLRLFSMYPVARQAPGFAQASAARRRDVSCRDPNWVK